MDRPVNDSVGEDNDIPEKTMQDDPAPAPGPPGPDPLSVTVRSYSPNNVNARTSLRLRPTTPGTYPYSNGETVPGPRPTNYGSLSPSPWPGMVQQPREESSGYQYEEFFGGTIQCPSCRGAGRIPREKENELVALIPFSDQRLQPRRTKLYVILAVLICTVIGSLLLFFLFPRAVDLESNMPNLTPTLRYVNRTEKHVFLSVINEFNVSNHNYFNVEVEEMSVQTFYDQRLVATVTNCTDMNVPLRATRPYSLVINMTFNQDEGFVADYCDGKFSFPHTLLMPFQVTMTSKSLGRSEQSTLTTYQHVLCSELKTL